MVEKRIPEESFEAHLITILNKAKEEDYQEKPEGDCTEELTLVQQQNQWKQRRFVARGWNRFDLPWSDAREISYYVTGIKWKSPHTWYLSLGGPGEEHGICLGPHNGAHQWATSEQEANPDRWVATADRTLPVTWSICVGDHYSEDNYGNFCLVFKKDK